MYIIHRVANPQLSALRDEIAGDYPAARFVEPALAWPAANFLA
jgi:hypothetical protein